MREIATKMEKNVNTAETRRKRGVGSHLKAATMKFIISATHLYHEFENAKEDDRAEHEVYQQLDGKGQSAEEITAELEEIAETGNRKGQICH